MPETNRQVILSQKPQGKLTPASFTLAESPIPTPGEGDVLVKAKYVSLDAANRAWMQGVTYRAGLETGEVMAGGALAEVVESRTPNLAPVVEVHHHEALDLQTLGHDQARHAARSVRRRRTVVL